jgi:hypothetical protein
MEVKLLPMFALLMTRIVWSLAWMIRSLMVPSSEYSEARVVAEAMGTEAADATAIMIARIEIAAVTEEEIEAETDGTTGTHGILIVEAIHTEVVTHTETRTEEAEGVEEETGIEETIEETTAALVAAVAVVEAEVAGVELADPAVDLCNEVCRSSGWSQSIIKFAGVYIICLRIPVGVYHDSLLKKLRK